MCKALKTFRDTITAATCGVFRVFLGACSGCCAAAWLYYLCPAGCIVMVIRLDSDVNSNNLAHMSNTEVTNAPHYHSAIRMWS